MKNQEALLKSLQSLKVMTMPIIQEFQIRGKQTELLTNNLNQTLAILSGQLEREMQQAIKAAAELQERINKVFRQPGTLDALVKLSAYFKQKMFLQEQRWGLTPYLLKSELLQTEELFMNFFLKDDCYHLKQMVETWFENSLFQRRQENLRGIVYTLRKTYSTEEAKSLEMAAYAIIPGLISNIEGVCRDFSVEIGLVPARSNKFKRKGNSRVEFEHWEVYKQLPVSGVWNYLSWLGLLGEELFAGSNVVRLKSQAEGADASAYEVFNRHRILHGNVTDYGIPSNLIRLFLLLDFLSVFRAEKYQGLLSRES